MVASTDAFHNYFWGDKNTGYEVLLLNMKQGVVASKEFHDIMRERANYEEAFSKSLRRLSEKASTVTAVGSFFPVWTVIKKYVDSMSKIHGDFSAKFKELCHELSTFKTETSSKTNKLFKEHPEIVKTAAALTNIKSSLEHVNKCKKLYHQKHKELIENEDGLTKSGNTTEKTDKEQEKIQQKFVKSQDAFVLAENTYKASVEKYNKCQEEYNEEMGASCKFFGEMEQTQLTQMVEFARRFGDIESTLIEELRKNCENVLGGDPDEGVIGVVGYTPDHLIDLFVEEKTTGVEMCPEMETELLSVKDPPVLISTPKPSHIDKSSDSGSVASLPSAHNATAASGNSNMNSMTLAMSNVSMKAFKKMIKTKKNKPKTKSEDSKSVDSKNEQEEEEGLGDNISEKSTSEQDSAGGQRSEIDFYERAHGGGGFFSSDDDDGREDDSSDEDGLTAKVRTIKIRNTDETSNGSDLQATEEQLRKATEKLTLNSCLSPNTYHRDRSKTHNPQLFSGHSHSLVDLPVSPEPQPKATFPTTFNTPRAKSVSGNLDSPRGAHRRFNNTEAGSAVNNSEAWAVFDDSFKSVPDSTKGDGGLAGGPWSTPPPAKRNLFADHQIDIVPRSKSEDREDGMEGLLGFAPPKTPNPSETKKDIEDLLSITMDETRAMSPNSEYMTAESSPTQPSECDEVQIVPPDTPDEPELGEDMPRKKRLPSLIEFSPVRPLADSEGASDPLSSTQKSESDLAGEQGSSDLGDTDSGVAVDRDSPSNLGISNDLEMEDSKLLSPLSVSSKNSVDCDTSLTSDPKSEGSLLEGDTPHANSLILQPNTNGIMPMLKPSLATRGVPEALVPDSGRHGSTESVEFSASLEETVESDREDMIYPIAIAIIETASAIFKPGNDCTSKVEGELIMSLPVDAAADLSMCPLPPALKIRLVSTTTPNSFIVNRQIFSIKPPSIRDVLEVNMNLLQDFLRKRLDVIGNSQRINIPLLKYKSPLMKTDLAPLIAHSYWTQNGEEMTVTINASVNKSLEEHNFYFPRISYTNCLGDKVSLSTSDPPAEIVNNRLKWECVDVGNEIVDHPDRFTATFESGSDSVPSRTDIEFEIEGVAICGTDVVLENSDSYIILTTVKKMKSDKYWCEPKMVESDC